MLDELQQKLELMFHTITLADWLRMSRSSFPSRLPWMKRASNRMT